MTAALEQAARWPAGRVAIGVVAASATLETYGDIHETLPWASVTKLLTALTVLMAVEEEIVTLDEPAGPPGATVRHLLAHASGLPPDGDRPIARPGERRIYSNAGFEQLGPSWPHEPGSPSPNWWTRTCSARSACEASTWSARRRMVPRGP